MARRNDEALSELLISLGEDDVNKLQQGGKIQIGVISFVNEPIFVTLRATDDRRKSSRSKGMTY
jgi:hypothetical protein